MDNKDLQKLVEAELEWEPSVDASSIGVSVIDGVVTLSGAVSTYAEKLAAERCALGIKGVRGVVENIEVRAIGIGGLKDDDIALRALQSLEWNTIVPDDAVRVKVERGHLTLTGEVDWHYQRQAAEKAVHGLRGVISVSNEIRLKQRATPANIHSRIEGALHRQARLDADNIRVAVDGGKVRLEGKVHSWSDRSLVENAAWAAPGVSAVEDRIMIGG
jgi:osmotically-inducible protein OsmY